MIIELKTSSNFAKIDTKGAELISYKDIFNFEYIWQKDEKYWNRSSPVLFPIVGNLRDGKVNIAGAEYSIGKHGFCRDAEFEVVSQSNTRVILTYRFNEETLAVYPYKFSLTLTYKLTDEGIKISYTVENLDDKPIDFCLGAHPAFNIPLVKGESFENYILEFEKNEDGGCPVYDLEKSEVNINNRVDITKGSNKINLNYSLFDEDAIIFDKLNSKAVKVYSKTNGRGVLVSFEGFKFVAFWTPIKMQAPFLCIEPWSGMAVCSDEDNSYENKRGITHLDIGQEAEFSLTILPL